jgi:iron complex outermembrane receptor protein
MKKSPGVRRYINIDKAIMTGFEASWMQQLPFKLASRLSIAYTLGEDLTTQKPLPEIPPFEINLGIHGKFFKDKLKPELFIRQAFDQYRVSETFGETKTSAFTLVNVKASFALNKYLHLAAGVNNLFNISYYEHLSRAMRIDNGRPLHAPGTNVFGTVTVRF